MSLTPGTRVGPYEIVSAIGAGGMGEVYRAHDTKLNRDVALKILPHLVAGDPDRLARFEREAQLLASLNHPNIAAIYGVEDSGPTRALVLELVEGPTLADRLAAGPIPVAEALAIARQIADALAVAHDAGIIHRDLKPANVKVRDDGTVKVLDFGLAKALAPDAAISSASAMNSPTLTARATDIGMIIGTAAYMAPEQARGKQADRRADLWAFGVVLYEMLTGRRAFDGPEVSDVLAAVLRDAPSLDALPADVPPGVRRLLRRTLEKDRARRLDSMTAARLELDDHDAAPQASPPASPAMTSRRGILIPVLAAAILSAAAAGAAVWRAMQPAPPETRRFAITPTSGAAIAIETNHHDVAIARDGSRVAYFSRAGQLNQVVVRDLSSFEPRVLAKLGEDARGASLSPDAEWIAYQGGSPIGNLAELYKAPVAGGVPVSICPIDHNLRGASWNTDGTIVFATVAAGTGLFRVSASGGTAETLTTPAAADGEADHLWPQHLPDGRHVLFAISRLDSTFDVGLLALDSKTWRVLIRSGTSPRYVSSGHIVFGHAGSLRAVAFDLARLQIIGEPVEMLSGVVMKESGATDFAVSDTGTLVYLPGEPQSVDRRLAWRDPDGRETILNLPPQNFGDIRISHDGRSAVAAVNAQAGSGLWLIDLVREVSSRLTPPEFSAMNPVWSPDGRRVAFWSAKGPVANEPAGIFVISAAGTSAPERLTSARPGRRHYPYSWTKDGTRLLFGDRSVDAAITEGDIMQVALDERRTVTPILAGPAVEGQPALSPDGRWLAYVQAESATASHIFIRPYPNVDDARIPVAMNTALAPLWSPDGATLYYRNVSLTSQHAVAIRTAGGTLSIGKPTVVTSLRDEGNTFTNIALPPVGRRMLAPVRPAAAVSSNEYRIVLNWTEELKARAPGKR